MSFLFPIFINAFMIIFYVYTIFSENSLMGGFVDWWARNEDGF